MPLQNKRQEYEYGYWLVDMHKDYFFLHSLCRFVIVKVSVNGTPPFPYKWLNICSQCVAN